MYARNRFIMNHGVLREQIWMLQWLPTTVASAVHAKVTAISNFFFNFTAVSVFMRYV